MHKLTVLYRKPEDVDGFEAHFRDVHTPIVQRYTGLRELRVTRFTGDPRGNPPEYHMATEMLFDDEDSLKAALTSDAGKESSKDFVGMSKQYGFRGDFMIGEER